jgi:hypothetical protein
VAAPFAESIWITCCSGRRQISKRSCSISGPTSTTIARIPHGKGEHPIRRCHDQSQISARLDGSPIVDLYFRPQWLPNFQIFELTVVSGQAPEKPGMKSCGVCVLSCSAFRGSDRFSVTRSVQKGRGISLSRRDLPVISALVSIRQRQLFDSVVLSELSYEGEAEGEPCLVFGCLLLCSLSASI